MYRTILVPLDGSALAERALPYARRLAMASRARLILVQAIEPSDLLDDSPDRDRAKAMADVEAYLAGLIPGRADGSVETAAYFDEAADTIVEESRLQRTDLIVMATHARAGFQRTIYGSVAERVFRQVDVPVLFVPPQSEQIWPESGPARLLIPLDGSGLAEEALGPAAELADALDAEILLLRVVNPPEYVRVEGYPDLPEGETVAFSDAPAAEAYLQTIAERLRSAGRTVRTRVESGDPATVIRTVAHDEKIAAIAMATHGRGGLARLIMGSVAAEIVRYARATVLLVRPTAMRFAEATKPPRDVGAPIL